MNNTKKAILAVLGAVDSVFYIFTPIMIASILGASGILSNYQISLVFVTASLSSIFRAIKIGWFK